MGLPCEQVSKHHVLGASPLFHIGCFTICIFNIICSDIYHDFVGVSYYVSFMNEFQHVIMLYSIGSVCMKLLPPACLLKLFSSRSIILRHDRRLLLGMSLSDGEVIDVGFRYLYPSFPSECY